MSKELIVYLDTNLTPELLEIGVRNELRHEINNLRKKLGYTKKDFMNIYWDALDVYIKINMGFYRGQEYLKKECGIKEIIKGVPSGKEPINLKLGSYNLFGRQYVREMKLFIEKL